MLAGLIASIALLSVFAPPALAVKVHPFLSKINIPGNEARPSGVAVNQSTHHVYVVNQLQGVIYDFEANGKLNAAHPQLTGAPSLQPYGVAVDNSGGPKDGYIYASDFSGQVQQFDPSGVATAVAIKAAAIPANGTPQGGGLPPVVNDGQFSPRGIAVDADGTIYVTEARNEAIVEFSATGEFIAQVGAGLVTNADGVAVGPGGNIYVATSHGLLELDPSGNCVNACTPIDPAVTGGVAVDAAGNVLVSATKGAGESSLNEYDPAGSLISSSGAEQLNSGFSIALDEGNGRLYVGDFASFTHGPDVHPDVKVFGPLLTLPDAITLPATVAGQSVTFKGEVGADGGDSATCLFQYTDEATFLEAGFQGAGEAPCAPAGPFTGEALSAVGANLKLNAGTTYRYRLLANSPKGSTPGTALTLTTGGPSIRSQSVGEISETTATLEATINPNASPTTYHFEYVDQAQFEINEFEDAIEVPLGGEAIGNGSEEVERAVEISGLIPGTGYRFRTVATNDLGEEAVGAPVRFLTYALANPSLPDSRAYEQASPVDKNGANVEGGINAVQAASDGSAVTFFSGAGIPGGEGAQNYPIFLARRGSSDWSTQGLSPPASTGPRGKAIGWSEDLLHSYSFGYSPGTPGTFYERDSSSGALSVITAGLAGSAGAPGEPIPGFVGAADSTVAFENSANLAAGAKAGKPNVYVWDRDSGQLRLASALNSGQAPSLGAFAGPYDWFGGSEDGGAGLHYYTQATHTISSDARRLFFTSADKHQLYVRINPLQEQSPLLGGECTDPTAACTLQVSASQASTPDPAGEQPAIFTEATPDGRYVFFISTGKLTDDATTGNQLYRYDTQSRELDDLSVGADPEASADVLGVLGVSADGAYAYFVANGVLAAGATPGSCKNLGGNTCSIYAWHEGVITTIARLSSQGNTHESDVANWLPTSELPVPTEKAARVDPGGRVLLFRSQLALTAYDNEGQDELYRAELTAGGPTLACISCNPTNAAPTGDASLQAIPPKFAAPRGQAATLTHNLASGGGRIFFDSPDKLVASDTNGVNDVYEWEAKGVGSCNSQSQNGGCLYLLSSGTSPLASYFADASASGNDAFFFTTQSLVRRDRDEIQDVYDARVGGGLAGQNQLPPEPCRGEACLGQEPVPPSFTPPTSGDIGGPGNVKPLKCKKGQKKVKKKGKTVCVKVGHQKQKKSPGKSKRGGRASK